MPDNKIGETVSATNRVGRVRLIRGNVGGFRQPGNKTPETGLAGWGGEDSNLRMAESKSAALPLGDAPMPLFIQAAARGGRTIMRGETSRNCGRQDKRR
jgi:hypothetical protein